MTKSRSLRPREGKCFSAAGTSSGKPFSCTNISLHLSWRGMKKKARGLKEKRRAAVTRTPSGASRKGENFKVVGKRRFCGISAGPLTPYSNSNFAKWRLSKYLRTYSPDGQSDKEGVEFKRFLISKWKVYTWHLCHVPLSYFCQHFVESFS